MKKRPVRSPHLQLDAELERMKAEAVRNLLTLIDAGMHYAHLRPVGGLDPAFERFMARVLHA